MSYFGGPSVTIENGVFLGDSLTLGPNIQQARISNTLVSRAGIHCAGRKVSVSRTAILYRQGTAVTVDAGHFELRIGSGALAVALDFEKAESPLRRRSRRRSE